MSETRRISILAVEDEDTWYKIYLDLPRVPFDKFVDFTRAKFYEEAKQFIGNSSFDIAIVDLSLSQRDSPQLKFEGIQLIQELSSQFPAPLVILSTGYMADATADPEFPKEFIFESFEKGEDLQKLKDAFSRAVKLKRFQHLLASASKYASGPSLITEELRAIISEFTGLTGAYICHLLLPSEDRDFLEIVTDTSGHDEGRRISVHDSITGEVFLSKSLHNIADTRKHSKYVPIVDDKEMRSELAVPLLEDGRAIGVLNMESQQLNAFSADHVLLMQIFSKFVVATLQSDRRRHDLRDLVGLTTNRLLEAVVKVERVFEAILELGEKQINAEYGFLARVVEDKLEIKATTNDKAYPPRTELHIDNSVCGLAVKRGYAINIEDVTQEPYASYFRPPRGVNIHSELVVPLRIEDKVIGVLNFESPEKAAFTAEDQRLLMMLANQAAVAIRISNELDKRERELRVQERAATILDLTAGMAHNVNSPADGILFDMSMLRMYYGDLINADARLKNYLHRIEEAAKKVKRVPQLIAERVEQYSPPVLIDTSDFINFGLARFGSTQEIPEDVSIEIEVLPQNLPSFYAYIESTPLVIYNLITNSIQAIKESEKQNGGSIRIGACYLQPESLVEVWVEDSGPGIPLDKREMVFERLYTSKENGGGTGLWWAKSHLEALKASIYVENGKQLTGARFVIHFPVI